MDLGLLISKLGGLLLLPPGFNIILFIASIVLFKFKRRLLARATAFISLISLILLSTPWVADSLLRSLQTTPALSSEQVKQLARGDSSTTAIVVLAGGRLSLAEEYGGIDTVSAKTLQRIQYAAWLHKKTQLPILVTGGSVYGEPTAEAVLMNQVMVSSFGIAPRWIETESKTTAENAKFSTEILKRNGINQIVLVTHADHMQRALIEFEQSSLNLIPAPTAFQSNKSVWTDYFPSAKGLLKSQRALHEMLGRIWYSI